MNCQNCHKPFEPKTPTQLYCSHRCRNTFTHRRKRNRKPLEIRYSASERLNRAKQDRRRRQHTRDLTVEQWVDALIFFENCCAYCGNKLMRAHREHFVPVKRGGGLTVKNIVPACPSCNSRKSSKDPLDWLVMQPKGLLAYARVSLYLAQK
jgi:5-methylcytosine-specific restriction endonuclease McrA